MLLICSIMFNKLMRYNIRDADMEMSDGHMKDMFDVNTQTAMI